ncbi:C40 family peptidase [Microcoleus sp. FACHB-672]|uniref:C40 family peptidase n=1 Tax=Microcoleus sp. FACHB-672 TaxID=2692825 RepID=UPI001683F83E|nr:C40 family peptidase [Microcoleus sp. FACHB-672]MBD2041812.1 C40 family peptidase [Microcoleus sp. FACHB-672]
MVSIAQLQATLTSNPDEALLREYSCSANLNLYDSPNCDGLATQAAVGRHLRIVSLPADENDKNPATSIKVQLCEDDYPGWLAISDLDWLELVSQLYQANTLSEEEIKQRLPAAIAFTHAAMQISNEYLWGGTLGPNYDCSGLMQAAFSSVGVWLPRDAYQQEAFTQPIAIDDLQPGDLIFFGPAHKATHVALYLGEGNYIHSSGKNQGRNGIGIDILSENGHEVSQAYYRQLRGAGRIVASYQPGAIETGKA